MVDGRTLLNLYNSNEKRKKKRTKKQREKQAREGKTNGERFVKKRPN